MVERKYYRCMRCNARWIKISDIWCEDCISVAHLEMCHEKTMVCNCHEFEPFPPKFKIPKLYRRYIKQCQQMKWEDVP
jgi:hypothetical protein